MRPLVARLHCHAGSLHRRRRDVRHFRRAINDPPWAPKRAGEETARTARPPSPSRSPLLAAVELGGTSESHRRGRAGVASGSPASNSVMTITRCRRMRQYATDKAEWDQLQYKWEEGHQADSCTATNDARVARGYSITSLANSVIGKVSPSAWAVFKLIISSIFVDCWIGRSAGFSPLRIRPT